MNHDNARAARAVVGDPAVVGVSQPLDRKLCVPAFRRFALFKRYLNSQVSQNTMRFTVFARSGTRAAR